MKKVLKIFSKITKVCKNGCFFRPTRHKTKRRHLAASGGVDFFCRLATRAKLGPPEDRESRHECGTFSACLGIRVVVCAARFSNKLKLARDEKLNYTKQVPACLCFRSGHFEVVFLVEKAPKHIFAPKTNAPTSPAFHSFYLVVPSEYVVRSPQPKFNPPCNYQNKKCREGMFMYHPRFLRSIQEYTIINSWIALPLRQGEFPVGVLLVRQDADSLHDGDGIHTDPERCGYRNISTSSSQRRPCLLCVPAYSRETCTSISNSYIPGGVCYLITLLTVCPYCLLTICMRISNSYQGVCTILLYCLQYAHTAYSEYVCCYRSRKATCSSQYSNT